MHHVEENKDYRQLYEQTLEKLQQEEKTADRVKSEFLANISHEIRTPLNGVIGMLQLLQRTELNEEQQEFLDSASLSAANLLTILNDILDFSKMEAGKIEFVEFGFSLQDMLERIIAIFGNCPNRNNITITSTIGENVPAFIISDQKRLRQILFNVIGNAVKFTEEGTVSIHVSTESGDVLMFQITDTGVGVSNAEMDCIFEPFQQSDGSYTRKYSGLGLGLSIVKRLVTLMDGTISIESEQGKGTCVSISIPVKTHQPPAAKEKMEPAAGEQQGLRILTAEDEQINRKTITRTLEKMGHQGTCVADGRDVLPALRGRPFDCVLLDIQLPGEDGLKVLKEIRGDTSGGFDPSIPVIVLTAHAMKGDREFFLAEGADGYIAKPAEYSALERLLSEIQAAKIQKNRYV